MYFEGRSVGAREVEEGAERAEEVLVGLERTWLMS
jgi:hypothetical protein